MPLVTAAQHGDARAFEALYARFARHVHAVLLARVPPDAAPDLTQDVFLKAWSTLKTLREPAAFPGWIGAIARRLAVDYRRAARPEVALEDRFAAADAPDRGVAARQALDAIRTLPEAYRETLLLRLVGVAPGRKLRP